MAPAEWAKRGRGQTGRPFDCGIAAAFAGRERNADRQNDRPAVLPQGGLFLPDQLRKFDEKHAKAKQ
jgi:hypothetical protein